MKKLRILFGISGSFCNHAAVLKQLKLLCTQHDVEIIVSYSVYHFDTRFHPGTEWIRQLEELSGHKVLHTLLEAEQIGPLNHHDLMIIAPMTATVCAKLVHGIYDHPVVLAAKAMLRNQKTILFGFSSNDALSISGVNLMTLMNRKNFYALPMYQDDCLHKPHSLVARWDLLPEAIEAALQQHQLQPLFGRNPA